MHDWADALFVYLNNDAKSHARKMIEPLLLIYQPSRDTLRGRLGPHATGFHKMLMDGEVHPDDIFASLAALAAADNL